MTDGPTWTEVADTAVKIGFGGIIAAISAYFLTKRNQEHDFNKEYFRRRQDVIEKVSASFETIHAFFFKVCIDYTFLVEVLHAGLTASDSDRDKYHGFMKEIGEKLHELHVLEGKLLVVGASDATQALQQYRLQAAEVNDMIQLNKPKLKKQDVEAVTNELFRRKDKFYGELAKSFKTI